MLTFSIVRVKRSQSRQDQLSGVYLSYNGQKSNMNLLCLKKKIVHPVHYAVEVGQVGQVIFMIEIRKTQID